MNIERISPSSYNTWDFCQHKFFLEQRLKYYFPAGKAADFGTAVHTVMEILARFKIADQDNDPNESIKFRKHEINRSTYTIDELINIAISSFKDGYFTSAEIREMKKCVETAITYSNCCYDPRNQDIIGCEYDVKIVFDDAWAKTHNGEQFFLNGKIDLVTKTKEYPDFYEIIDYKTSGSLRDFNTQKTKNYNDFYDDIQLACYHYTATKIFGEDKSFLLTIFFLKLRDCFSIPFTPEDLPKTKQRIKERFLEISNCETPVLTRGFHCKKFCPFGKMTPSQGDTTFPDMVQESNNGIAKAGSPMTICDASMYHINKYGLQYVEDHFKKSYKKNKDTE